ncbi:MAG: Transcriptional regulator, TrmB [Parcubacteria group bacterium GW2011_GWC2_39_14]|nr:MAG: Transcriptional regulator, TrmB [Parcubacteria group bacterium GW2011_GWC2_39_14]KKR55068.1 MAG: Transcriptional regulator, TrmB [Parcubacteria group bacterium GW2011_GWA2_40_23]
MLLQTLQNIGLSLNEAKIYESLLALKEAGVGTISTHSKIHRRNVYDTVGRLVDKGLIFPIISKGENKYAPVDPGKLLELLKEKEAELRLILPELKRTFEEKESPQEACIYRGLEGFKNYMRDILHEGKDVYFIGAKLGWLDPRINTFLTKFLVEAKKKKINFYHIFDIEVQEKTPPGELVLMGNNNRFMPKEFSTISAADIFGDYVVTFTGLNYKSISDDVTIFVLRDKKLADSYRIWWKFMYKNCIKT